MEVLGVCVMVEIKFSHEYPKLWGQKTAVLLNIKIIDSNSITPDLKEYDTKFNENEHYPLPEGRLIHLTFLGDKNIPFSSIRSFYPQKFDYYSKSVGKQFKLTRVFK